MTAFEHGELGKDHPLPSLPMRPFVVLLASTAFLAAPLRAQLVTPRTVPVIQDEQFDLTPSSRPGFGGLSIALDDTLADPFTNPAKAMRLRGVTFTSSPFSHSISGNGGGGRTLPISFLANAGTWSAAFLGAMQQIDHGGSNGTLATSDRSANNQYLTAVLARRIGQGVDVGISALRADLNAVDGVDLLYAGSDRIVQGGSLSDVRLGATKEFEPGHVLELLVLRNVTSMQHDVHFSTWTYNPTLRTNTLAERSEVNLDKTNIWGLHSEYTQPIGTEGWRLGALATANHLSHPKIPNYTIQNVPRDPGTTRSFNLGVGAARSTGPVTVGFDYVIEPMTSNTWADAATNTARADGSVIPAGDKTIENHFTFHNAKIRFGVGHTWFTDSASQGSFGLDFGISAYSISYDLLQTNNIARTVRSQHEDWVEAGPSFGFRYRSRDLELSYAFRANCGSGGCDMGFWSGDKVNIVQPAATTGGIIAAPSSQLTIQGRSSTSHHFTIAVPIR